jgi:cytochrome c-type biogenesis protein CcmH
MAMTPELKLSSFGKVVVVARVSRSGLATPQKGDLEATTAPVAPGTKGIRLELSAQAPEGRGPNAKAAAN